MHSRHRLLLIALLTPLLLAGCAPSVPFSSAGTAGALVRGNVHGGQQPVSGSLVQVWSVGTSGYGSPAIALASTTTDADGNFSFPSNSYTCPYNDTPVYLTATGGDPGAGANANLRLAAGLGDCQSAQSASVVINEVTTAATAFALAQFFTTTLGYGSDDDIGGPTSGSGDVYTAGLMLANRSTIPTLVTIAAGTANVGNPAIVVEDQKLNAIANSLAACVNTTGETAISDTTTPCGILFNATAPPSGNRPSDTLQAAVQMARYPYQNVATIFNLTSSTAPFVGMPSAPSDWLLGVKYTSSSFGLGVNNASTSNIDIDASGRVWFPTNTSASAGVGYFDPASSTFNGPYSYAAGTHPQNIAIDNSGTVWAADMNSWMLSGVSSANPASTSVAGSSAAWNMVAPAIGPGNELYASYYDGVNSEARVASYDASTLVANYFSYFHDLAVDLTVASDGTVLGLTGDGSGLHLERVASANNWVDTAYNSSSSGQLIQIGMGSSNNTLVTVAGQNKFCTSSGNNNPDGPGGCSTSGDFNLAFPEGVAIDGSGYVWVANNGSRSISTFPSSLVADARTGNSLHDATHGNTMTAPYGLAIDASGNVWLSNAGCTSTSCVPGDFVLSEVIGAASPAITPRAAQIYGGNFTGTRPTH